MKFALHYSYQSRTGHWVDAYHNSLEQIALAEKFGFDMVTTSEHHMVEDNGYFPSNMVTCAGIATRTEKMRIGTCVLLLPFYHPLAVAEDATVLDIMSRGRFVLGVGLGYRREEFAAFNVPFEQRAARFEEALGLVRRLMTERSVTHPGPYFPMEDVTLMPRPVQKPSPPIWVAAKLPAAIRRAARMGNAWLADPITPLKVLKERKQVYLDALAETGKDASQVEFPLRREAYVAEESERAWEEAREPMLYNYQEYLDWGHLVDDEGRPVKRGAEAMENLRQRFIVGSPDDCIRQIKRYQEELGTTSMHFRIQFPGLDHGKILNSIRLLGEEVLPHFQRPAAGQRA